MGNLIVSGKDSVTGQQRIADEDDRLVDSSGNAVAGVFEYVPGVNYSVVSGSTTGANNAVELSYSFAQGENCRIWDSFTKIEPFGLGGYSEHSCFVQGSDVQVAGYASFAQGTRCLATYGFAQGIDVFNRGSYWCFAQGSNISTDSNFQSFYTLMQGRNIYIGNTNAGMIQGYNINTSQAEQCFAQGQDIDIYYGDQVFAQGQDVHITGNPAYRVFAQGQDIDVSASGCSDLFMQGFDLHIADTIGQTFIQGRNIDLIGPYSEIIFAQGFGLTSQGATRVSMQGSNQNVKGHSIFAQGTSNNINSNAYLSSTGYAITAQGDSITIGGVAGLAYNTFAQGKSINVGDFRDVFAQGSNLTLAGNRTFVQGKWATSIRDDQKTWGSNRNGTFYNNSPAQKAHLIKYVSTANNTPTTLATLDLESDKAYTLRVMVVAKDRDTTDESASFALAQGLAYRDSSDPAVLVGADSAGEISLTSVSSGAQSATWEAKLVEDGNNILLQVTGDVADTVDWCTDFEFVEVLGATA